MTEETVTFKRSEFDSILKAAFPTVRPEDRADHVSLILDEAKANKKVERAFDVFIEAKDRFLQEHPTMLDLDACIKFALRAALLAVEEK